MSSTSVLTVSYETGYPALVKKPGAKAIEHTAGPGFIARLKACGEISHGTKGTLSGGHTWTAGTSFLFKDVLFGMVCLPLIGWPVGSAEEVWC